MIFDPEKKWAMPSGRNRRGVNHVHHLGFHELDASEELSRYFGAVGVSNDLTGATSSS